MKGGYLHEFILETLETSFREHGFRVSRQVPSRPGRKTGYIDQVVSWDSTLLAVEVELSSRRVANDLVKAMDLGAFLWIVVPNHKVALSVRRRLNVLRVQEREPWLCVLTLNRALKRVPHCFSLFSPSKVGGK